MITSLRENVVSNIQPEPWEKKQQEASKGR